MYFALFEKSFIVSVVNSVVSLCESCNYNTGVSIVIMLAIRVKLQERFNG